MKLFSELHRMLEKHMTKRHMLFDSHHGRQGKLLNTSRIEYIWYHLHRLPEIHPHSQITLLLRPDMHPYNNNILYIDFPILILITCYSNISVAVPLH